MAPRIVTALQNRVRPRRWLRWLLAPRRAKRHGLVGPWDSWEEKRRFQIAFLREAGLLPQHALLDLGCGTLRGGIPIIEYLEPGHYTGVDVRASALRDAARELRDYRLEAKRARLVRVGRLADLDLGAAFDIVWAFSLLYHLADATLNECMACAARHLKQDGTFYANALIGSRPDGAWREFPCVWRPVAFYEAAAGRYGLTFTDLGALLPWEPEARLFAMTHHG